MKNLLIALLCSASLTAQTFDFSCEDPAIWSDTMETMEVCGLVTIGTETKMICNDVPAMIWAYSKDDISAQYTISSAPWPLVGFRATITTADPNHPSANYIGKTEEEVHQAIQKDIQE